jgi:hypothetical protein
MKRLTVALLLLSLARTADAVDLPDEGRCPPYPVSPGSGEPRPDDVIPPAFRPGDTLEFGAAEKLARYLPPEVWERREVFFFEGMRMEIGPCQRRYPTSKAFEAATEAGAGKASVDADGNLRGWTGAGMPFRRQDIADAAADAGARWAWAHRYRFVGGGFRGAFRILHVQKRGRSIETYEGEIFYAPLDEGSNRFAAGGRFQKPEVSRGLAWRQFRPAQADEDAARSDDIFVWMPEERRVRRAPPTLVDGLYMPSYTRANVPGSGRLLLPNDQNISTPDSSISSAENWRRGFTGLFVRPNAYAWSLIEFRDLIAPINSTRFGFPARGERSYGPSGLSVASDRWEIRRAVLIEGLAKSQELPASRVRLWLDAQTAQPLYWITRRASGAIDEVSIFVGRYSGDDPLAPAPDGEGSGVILPAAQSTWQAGGESWLRESYELRADPPTEKERATFTSTQALQRKGR